MVGSMIVAAIAETAVAAFTTAQAIAAFAINFAVSQIVTRVFGQDQQGPQDSGTRQQVPPSNSNAIPVVYGDAYLGGTFVDAVLSEDQKVMYYVIAVSCISPNGDFGFDTTDMYYGDRKITFDGTDLAKVVSLTDEAGNVDSNINGSLWVYLYKSNTAGTITPLNSSYLPNDGQVMGATTIASTYRWPSSGRQMNGLAFAIVRLHYNQDAGTTSLSPITFKASHHLNGTGYAIPGDVWYDYITNVAYGGAVDPAFVDADSATALNAYSNEIITFDTYVGSPSTQPRYRINGVLDAGQPVLSNLDKIMTCCDSWMAYNAASGKWAAVINKAESASYAFNDNNIIGEIRVSASDITQSINQVEAKFPNKDARYQPDFVNLATPSLLLYPNEPDNKYSVSYDLCNDSVQAQYLANRVLEQAREDLIVSFSTTYYGIQVDAGTVVSVTNSDYGWSNKLFRVVKVNEASLPDGSLGARLEMTEYSAAVYDDFNITEYAPVPNSGIPSVGYFSALTAPTVTGYATATIPYFDVTVVIPTTGRVTFIDLYYTTSATPTVADWKLITSAITSNSQPYTNGSTFTFANQLLPSNTYYFGYIVGNQISQSKISPQSSSFVWGPTGMSAPFVDISGFTSFTKTSANTYTPTTATLTAIVQNVTSPTYAWSITGATPSSGTSSSIVITPTAVATSVVAQLTVNGSNLTSPIVKSVTMAIVLQVDKFATANLYQWSSTTPGNPSGTSTYTWATGANSSYSGGNGWSVTVPTNPGIAGLILFIASKQVSDVSTVATTTVSWSSGYAISTNSENGANGVQSAEAIVYQWSTTIPTITGTSTYTWATGAVSSPPTSWFTTISDTGTAGQTLWSAKVALTDSVTATTSTVNWATASIVPFGYVGTTGAVGRIAYTATSLTLNSSPSVYIVSGDNLPAVNSWNSAPVRVASTANITTLSGLLTIDGVTLVANDRVLVKNQTASQNNGIYVAASTAWTRATDANTWDEFIGLKVFVSNGTANANTFWQSNAASGGTLGTTAIAFTSTTIATTTWTSTTPTLTTGQQVWQSDGVYNPTTNQTIWEVPYLSSLKVGNLSAISTNTGSLTVSGNVTIGSYGNIRGGQTAYNTGTGFFLGYSATTYKFSIGSSTANLTWDGSAVTVTGGVIQTGTSGARLVMGGPSYQQALMGYNTGGGLTLGINANTGQVFASNYTGTIAGDFDNVSSSFPALRGINGSTGNGVGIEGKSDNYFGGAFYGGTTSSPLYINPTGALPTKGAILGALCVYNNLLYFHNGTTWKQVSLI